MAKPDFPYAQIPKFQYQDLNDHHYQTFDRQTLKFSFHPIIRKPTVPLSPNHTADVANTGPEKEADTENPLAEENPADIFSSPPEESSSPESESKSD
jgi:hypothetical protein